MRIAVVLGFLCACGSGDRKLKEQVGDLEMQTAALRDEVARLTTNDEALRKTFGRMISEFGAVLIYSGIMNEDAKTPVTNWWCDNMMCFRGRASCDTRGGIFDAPQAGCVTSRAAYCPVPPRPKDTLCFRTRSVCAEITERVCIGVE